LVLLLSAIYCHGQVAGTIEVPADELAKHANEYEGKKVEVVGCIAHVCGVDGRKMKMKTPGGEIIKIEAGGPEDKFGKDYNKKLVSVRGVVKVTRIGKAYIDRIEKEGRLLCHIDHKACKDKQWVNRKVEEGKAEAMLKHDIAALRNKLKQSGKKELCYVCILAEYIEVIDS
jgi:hypothetical protein